MEEPASPSPNQSKRLQIFLFAFPGWWIAVKGIEAGLLRSQNPEWFGLYSTNKLLFLLGSAAFATAWIILTPRLAPLWSSPKALLGIVKYPTRFFLVLATLSCIPFFNQGITVGEDIAEQVKSSMQWTRGQVTAPNFVSRPHWQDLSKDKTSWHIRPPFASWTALPGLSVGLPLGDSIRLSLFLFAIIGGLGWIHLAKRMNLDSRGVCVLALTLSLATGSATTAFSTTNSVLFTCVPWCLLWSFKISESFSTENFPPKKTLWLAIIFYISLGSFAWIKLSGMVVAITIGTIPLLIVFFSRPVYQTNKKILAILAAGLLIFAPYLALEKTNRSKSDLSASQMYINIDYNKQASLWGNHFTESTRGKLLLWSLVGAPGYSLPVKSIIHGMRDLLLQFHSLKSWLVANQLNPHALLAGSMGILMSFLLILNLRNIWKHLPILTKVLFATFLAVPFMGLAVISRIHGFNYCLYHAHTTEFVLVLSLPALFALFQNFSEKPKNPALLLCTICFILPITSHAESLLSQPFVKNKTWLPSATEERRGMGGSKFSSAIDLVENHSKRRSDILLFLPDGDMGDLLLRTKLRTMAIHFAKDNFPAKGPCRSSKPVTIYCAYSSTLAKNPDFVSALQSNFPQSSDFTELASPEDGKIAVLRIVLDPNPNS